MSKVKNLTLSAMKKEDSKRFHKRKKIMVQGYSVEIDEVFRPTKLQDLMKELTKQIVYVTKNEEIDFDLVDWMVYANFMLVKYFTSLNVPDNFEEQIAMMNIMLDNDFLEPIIKAFDENELQKFSDMFARINEENPYLDMIVAQALEGEEFGADVEVVGDTDGENIERVGEEDTGEN